MQPYFTLYYLISLLDNSTIPAGAIFEHVGFNSSTNLPPNFVLCDGRSFSSNDTKICASSNSVCTTPDLQGRTVIGEGTGPGLSIKTFGSVGGTERVTLNNTQIPVHFHSNLCATNDTGNSDTPEGNVFATSVIGNAYTSAPQPGVFMPITSLTGIIFFLKKKNSLHNLLF